MKSIISFFAMSLCFVMVVFSQGSGPGSSQFKHKGVPYFFADASVFKNEKNEPTIDVYLKVPNGSFSYLLNNNQYVADYEISFVFSDSSGNVWLNEIQKGKFELTRFEETKTLDDYQLFRKTLPASVGKHQIRIQIRDNNNRKKYDQFLKVVVQNFETDLTVSDVLLIVPAKNNELSQAISGIPLVDNIVENISKGFDLYHEIYHKGRSGQRIKIQYALYDLKNDIIGKESVYETTIQYELADNEKLPVYFRVNSNQIGSGNYRLFVRAIDQDGGIVGSSTKDVLLTWFITPGSEMDLDDAIRQMLFIATTDEVAFIQQGNSFEDKMARFDLFWKKRDPTLDTEFNEIKHEYYKRVRISNAKFSGYRRPGWQTDRGMIFITFGNPDHVEDTISSADLKPYQIWYYYDIRRRYYFVDDQGFNDYRMVNSMYGESSVIRENFTPEN